MDEKVCLQQFQDGSRQSYLVTSRLYTRSWIFVWFNRVYIHFCSCIRSRQQSSCRSDIVYRLFNVLDSRRSHYLPPFGYSIQRNQILRRVCCWQAIKQPQRQSHNQSIIEQIYGVMTRLQSANDLLGIEALPYVHIERWTHHGHEGKGAHQSRKRRELLETLFTWAVINRYTKGEAKTHTCEYVKYIDHLMRETYSNWAAAVGR